MGLNNRLQGFYTREGAGVYKNGPQKGPVRRFLQIFCTKWTSLLRANLLYVLLALPLLTNGLGEAGMTYITRSAARGRFAYPAHDFFKTVKRTWKRALPVGLINLAVWAVLVYNLYFYVMSLFFRVDGSEAPTLHWLLFAINLLGMLMFEFMNYYIPFMLVTFSLNIKQMYKNAFMFSLHNFKQNICIYGILFGVTLVLLFPFLLIDYRIWAAILLLLLVLIYPAFRSLLVQYAVFPYIKKNMIDPYYEAHPEASKKAMRALNIEVEDEEEQQAVFDDRDPDKM